MPTEPENTPDELQAVEDEQKPTTKTAPSYVQIEKRHLYLALIPIALLLGFAGGYLVWGQDDTASPAQDVSNAPAPEAAASTLEATRIDVDPGDDPSLGPHDAPITIVEFSDFNCGFCRRWHQEVSQELFASFPEQIRFVYKDFPIVGGGRAGFLGAQAAHCAEEQDAYWEFHDALFSGSYVLDSAGVDQVAVDLGIDLESFKACMVEARYAEEVRDDFNYGVSLGVTSTPTFFVNGLPLVGAQPLANFAEIIDGELSN